MKGVRGYISSNVRDLGGAQVQKDDILVMLEKIYNAGGQADMLVCGSFNARVMDAWKESNIRYVSGEALGGTYGTTVGMLQTRFGEPKIVLKRGIPQSVMLLITSGNIGVGPLSGNGLTGAFTHTVAGYEGDRTKGQIVGEYTCEVRLEKTHALIKSTSVS
jgi:hypothetical protein